MRAPAQLEATANSLNLGDAAFIPYWPAPLSGANGPFSSSIDRTWSEGIWGGRARRPRR